MAEIKDISLMDEEEYELFMAQVESGAYDELDDTESDEIEDEIADEEEEEDTTDNEDTDQDADTDEDDETTEQDDDSADEDTSDDSEEDEEEDTPVGDDTKETKDTTSETTEPIDGAATDTVKIDQVEYEKYKKFYDEVANAEFTANGKKVKGFVDPAKIIQAQQMAYGYSDKMAGFKQYKPFMMPLKEKGFLEDPDKFNFLMEIADGNVDAIKAHIKHLKIDPMEMDLDEINYVAKDHRASDETISLQESIDLAAQVGVKDRLNKVIGGEWDNSSVKEFVEDPEVRQHLIEHMSNGVYDLVQDKIKELKVLHPTFLDQTNVNQYRVAYAELVKEYKAKAEAEAASKASTSVEAEKSKLLEQQKQEEYKRSVAEKNKQADEQRKKAVSVNKRAKPVKKAAAFDPMKLDGDDLDSFVDSLINGR